MANSTRVASNMYPSLTYDDAPAAIEWLCRAFGFKKRLVVPGPNGTVVHSELSFGDGVIMVSSAKPEQGRLGPRSLTGVNQGLCVQVDDPDAHFARAKSAGASIVQDLKDEEYGSRGYMAKDLEGHQWYFGTYRPGAHWEKAAVEACSTREAESGQFAVGQIDHVEFFVPSRRQAAEWYGRVLGLSVVEKHLGWAEDPEGPLMISSDGGSTKLALFRGAHQGSRETAGFHRVAFRVGAQDFEKFLNRLADLGVTDHRGTPLTPDAVKDHGGARSIYFSDPFGHRLELTTYSDRREGSSGK